MFFVPFFRGAGGLANNIRSDNGVPFAIPQQQKAVANSNPKVRGEFTDLAKNQSIEISKYGPKASVDFLSDTLNLASVLPKEMIARELNLLAAALDASFVALSYTD